MDLSTSTALITGANRGFGRHLAEQLLARGARVYAGARDPGSVDLPGAVPVALDVTDAASIAGAVAATGDVTLLVNNAGINNRASLESGSIADFRAQMDVQYYGTLEVTRAFAPQLARAGSSAVLNVLSAASWFTEPYYAPYAASKAAQWSLTNALRLWLAGQGTQVSGLHVGLMDTDMTRGFEMEKLDPARVATIALDALAAGEREIVADDTSRQALAGLSGGVAVMYPQLA